MSPEEARKQANNIMEMFWHNFLKSEPAFVMRDVIAIALENANNQTALPRDEKPKPKPEKAFVAKETTYDRRYDSQGYCDNPGRGY